jgi:hypothetical protein
MNILLSCGGMARKLECHQNGFIGESWNTSISRALNVEAILTWTD